jgi:hypothetical protein
MNILKIETRLNRNKAEAAFKSIMPKKKTPKKISFEDRESPNKRYTKNDFDIDKMFESIEVPGDFDIWWIP